MSAGTQPIQGDLPPETVVFWKAVAAAFPQCSSLGSWGDRSHAARKSDHNRVTTSGKRGPHAIDAMTADPALHARIVAWALLNRDRYGISLIISRRRKWSAASAWLPRPYLGVSGHFDHVHMSNDGTIISSPVPKVKVILHLPDGRLIQWDGRIVNGVRIGHHISTIAEAEALLAAGYTQIEFNGSVSA